MEYKENAELCHCKHVTLADIDRALAQTNRFSDVEREFQEVQKITSCSTGGGGGTCLAPQGGHESADVHKLFPRLRRLP